MMQPANYGLGNGSQPIRVAVRRMVSGPPGLHHREVLREVCTRWRLVLVVRLVKLADVRTRVGHSRARFANLLHEELITVARPSAPNLSGTRKLRASKLEQND